MSAASMYHGHVNDLVFDQHDKWKRFGLALHIGPDPFAGFINNSNPRLIFSYFIEDVEQPGHMSLISQSDLGSENYGIANGQTMLCQLHDPSLVGTLQHCWKREKKNVIPEVAWGQLRRRWMPGYETLIDSGIHRGCLAFRWVFIPWLQAELDAYRDRVNFTAKLRADRNKVLVPHGVPAHIYEEPEAYECLNFKITVDPAHVRTVKERLAPADHPVFELVPPSFHDYCFKFYQDLGSPTIT
ncbi:hypothetical protein C8J56DRAFT_1017277 [Mycena floridula]|nr:hypothetical protein C8J56DRAFT_1017277 [Mycena floridula]